MFGISFWEILIVLIIALIFIGPKQLPQIAKMLGSSVAWLQRNFYKAQNELDKQLKQEELEKNIKRAHTAEQDNKDNSKSFSPLTTASQQVNPEKAASLRNRVSDEAIQSKQDNKTS